MNSTMARYYRIQPSGLDLDHRSSTSCLCSVEGWDCGAEKGEDGLCLADGLHVFETAENALHPDGGIQAYGDEVVVIEAPEDAAVENEDVEGIQLDTSVACIVARYTVAAFRKAVDEGRFA